MPDLDYPLRYSQNSIAIASDDRAPISHVRHALETILRERYLFPDFGMPLLTWEASLPQAVIAQIYAAIERITQKSAEVRIMGINEATLYIEITIEQEREQLALSLPI